MPSSACKKKQNCQWRTKPTRGSVMRHTKLPPGQIWVTKRRNLVGFTPDSKHSDRDFVSTLWVKIRNTPCEQIFSALPSNPDIAQSSRTSHGQKLTCREWPSAHANVANL